MIKFKYENYTISISKKLIRKFTNYRQVNQNHEQGGMLIGSIIKDSNEIEINDYTKPMNDDIKNRYSFLRTTTHNKVLREKWIESNFTKLYLGEWHTHPQCNPVPSCTDKCSWKKLLVKACTESEVLIFIIIGTNSLIVWGGIRKNKKINNIGEILYEGI